MTKPNILQGRVNNPADDTRFEMMVNNLNVNWILRLLRLMAQNPETRKELQAILQDLLETGEL